jgi:hypothetical protein
LGPHLRLGVEASSPTLRASPMRASPFAIAPVENEDPIASIKRKHIAQKV